MYAHQGCRSQWRNNRPTHLPGSRVRLLGNTRAVSTHRGNPVAWKMACAYRTRQGRGGGRWVLKPATGRECGHPCETRPRVVVSLKGIPNDATYFSLTKGRECKLAALEGRALSPGRLQLTSPAPFLHFCIRKQLVSLSSSLLVFRVLSPLSRSLARSPALFITSPLTLCSIRHISILCFHLLSLPFSLSSPFHSFFFTILSYPITAQASSHHLVSLPHKRYHDT